jgi:hypothetical protein
VPKRAYVWKNFNDTAMQVIVRADALAAQYAADGYDLTLRQMYYQFVARDWFPADRRYWWDGDNRRWVHDPADLRATGNAEPNYKWLGKLINDARLAGFIDWEHITDRTRNLERLAMWNSPAEILDAVAAQYRTNLWLDQDCYVEVWVEKEALAGVVARPSERWFVPYFSCRGYVSQSEMWSASQRLIRKEKDGKETHIIHLGDHDPSGIDMTRDIRDRLALFGSSVEVHRIALNMDQIEALNPPPSPAKLTDSRSTDYIERFGDDSWELDALDPATLDTMIDDEIRRYVNMARWNRDTADMERERTELTAVSVNWEDVSGQLHRDGLVIEPEDDEE